MPISLTRKLQGLQAIYFEGLDFEVHRVGLTPDQVREYGLPSTPLKDTEKRADKWQAAMHCAQTEIDALASLRPALLERIADEVVSEYFDATLDGRVRQAKNAWERDAQDVLDAAGGAHLEQLRDDVATQLRDKRDEIQQILDAVRINPAALGLQLPLIPDIPAPEVYPNRTPLCSSGWTFALQCEELIASKQYRQVQ
jgi:hypothetical protein